MKAFLQRMHRDSKGFTVIELLIVVAILGVLAAVVMPNVNGRSGTAQPTEAPAAEPGSVQVAKAELSAVQTAMDTMMAKNSLSSVNATAATANMSSFPTGRGLYPKYLKIETTRGTYSCGTTGLVTQATNGY